MKDTIPDAIFAVARARGPDVAIRGEDGTEISYSELVDRSRAATAALIGRGIEAGDRIAIWAPNSPDWIVAALGLQAAGATLVPLNTRMKGKEAAYILEKSGARLLLTVGNFLGSNYPAMIAPHQPACTEAIFLFDSDASENGWSAFLNAGSAVSPDSVDARLAALTDGDVSDILFTSGTTGYPKGAVTTHGQNVRLYRQYAGVLGLGPEDNYLIVNPFFHTFGYKAGWLSSLLTGGTALPHAVFDPEKVLARIEKERVSVLPGPPTLYHSLLAAPYRDYDISSLRIAVTGAASVPKTLVQEMLEELKIRTVLTAYGLTETCGTVTMCRPEDSLETIANTAGRPIDGVEVKLVDNRGAAVALGEEGELLVRAPNVMVRYFEDFEATARAIDTQGWLRTGDVAVQDERGNVRITDRANDVFIVGGFNVYPAEIERMMTEHPAIDQAAVVGMPDDRMGEVAKAFVLLKPGQSIQPEEIIAWCRNSMANYKVPSSVEIVGELPLNASGKVQKFLLRKDMKREN